MATIPVQHGTTILDEVENVYDDITKRAYEKFLSRGGSGSIDIDDWLEAEREILLKPEARLVQKRGHYIVRFYLPQIDPAHVRVFVTTDDLVVQSSGRHPNSRIFKTLHFPQPIDLRRVRSAWVRGRLIVVALKAGISEASAAATEREASAGSHNGHR
jgi:DUF2934 family protein